MLGDLYKCHSPTQAAGESGEVFSTCLQNVMVEDLPPLERMHSGLKGGNLVKMAMRGAT